MEVCVSGRSCISGQLRPWGWGDTYLTLPGEPTPVRQGHPLCLPSRNARECLALSLICLMLFVPPLVASVQISPHGALDSLPPPVCRCCRGVEQPTWLSSCHSSLCLGPFHRRQCASCGLLILFSSPLQLCVCLEFKSRDCAFHSVPSLVSCAGLCA